MHREVESIFARVHAQIGKFATAEQIQLILDESVSDVCIIINTIIGLTASNATDGGFSKRIDRMICVPV